MARSRLSHELDEAAFDQRIQHPAGLFGTDVEFLLDHRTRHFRAVAQPLQDPLLAVRQWDITRRCMDTSTHRIGRP